MTKHKKDLHKHSEITDSEIQEEITSEVVGDEGVTPESVPPPPAAEAIPTPEQLLQDRLLRLQADFDNFRKRTAREKNEWALQANESFIRELLPVLDHFELGFKNADPAKDDVLIKGFRLVYDQLQAVLKKFGVTTINAVGQPFDPNFHEAIIHLPSPTVPADFVSEQTRVGYSLGNKLIRPAQVVVSQGC